MCLAARFYASGKNKEMSETVHTAMMPWHSISGMIMAVVGLSFFTACTWKSWVLRMMLLTRPHSICEFIFWVCHFLCFITTVQLYLRAVGDTKRPLIFLIISGACRMQCLEYAPCHCISSWAWPELLSEQLISQCISCVLVITMSYTEFRRKLSATDSQSSTIQKLLSETNFSSGHSGWYSEYRHQPVKCFACNLL